MMIECRAAVELADGKSAPAVVTVVEPRTSWHARMSVEIGGALQAIVFELECDEAWALNEQRQLVRVTTETAPPMPVGCFAVIRRGAMLWRLSWPWAASIVLRHVQQRTLVVRCRVSAPRACGLRAWGDHKLVPALGERAPVEMACDRIADLSDCVWIEPYPEGCPAALCITDHPDFDTVHKSTAVFDELARSGIRLTKGVFPVSQPQGDKREPGLDVPEYLALAQRLDASGSEIAFHGLGPRVDAPPIDECRRRADRLIPFRPETWIDHGTGSYLFVRDAKLPGGTPLHEFLRPYGIRNYWSYFDVWDNPFRVLASAHRVGARDIAQDLTGGLAALWSFRAPAGRLKSALYVAIHSTRNAVSARGVELLRKRKLDRAGRAAFREARRHHIDVGAAPMLIYALDGTGARAAPASDWVFDTVVLNHPAVQLRAPLLETLARRSDLMIAHTYLCATHSYLAGGAFEGDKLSDGFRRAVHDLADAQSRRMVATTSIRDLRASLVRFASARTLRTAHGWRVEGIAPGERVWIAGALSGAASSSHPCRADLRTAPASLGDMWGAASLPGTPEG